MCKLVSKLVQKELKQDIGQYKQRKRSKLLKIIQEASNYLVGSYLRVKIYSMFNERIKFI